jgi:uncharacterized protein (TIGR02246 family)
MEPGDIHERVEAAFNARDADALAALYEPDARMVNPDGSVAIGREAIREIWAGFIGLGGRITMTTRFAVAIGDIALLSNHWSFASEQAKASASTAEVARRQSDGTWLYIIDNPYGAGTGENA